MVKQLEKNKKAIVSEFIKGKGFNSSAISEILNSNEKKRKYSKKEICDAVMLRSISSRAYKTFRKNELTLKPLPSVRTIQRNIEIFQCEPGVQEQLFYLLKLKLSTEDSNCRKSVIMFDEISLKRRFEYCPRLKRVFNNHDKAQVVLLREISL